jgi:DNA-binding transcriptional regulator PaaX
MSSKNDFSKKILKILAEKPAISLPDLAGKFGNTGSKKSQYAITRSIKGLQESGLVESIHSGQNDYARLTKEGKKKAHSIKLDSDTTLLNTTWDGSWRIIMLDLPEERKAERESLRYLLKKAGFICLKNSAWISPYPFEHMFYNIKKDLNLSTELVIMVTNKVDEITEKELYKLFGF